MTFQQGIPVALNGRALAPVALIEALEDAAAAFGIGRGIHLGDTVLGTKGRVAFEAPAAEVLLTAHRELEKLTLGARQARVKDSVAAIYGDLVHEGQHLDPVCRDIEAFLLSSQSRVSGEVHLLFRPGSLFVEGVTSPHSLMAATRGVYGEAAGEWTATDAVGLLQAARPPRHAAHPGGEAERTMRPLVVDKIASVTQACDLEREVRIDGEIPCEEGVVVAVEILNNKANYNQLELTSGRMAQVKRGDIVVGALGHRQALFGYSGHLPEALVPGDTVQMLNMGGVLGVCDSINPERGVPFDCRVLGTVLVFPFLGERIGVPARIGQEKLDPDSKVDTGGVPVVALAGTCMDSRQDSRRVRHRQPTAARRAHHRCIQGDGCFAAQRHPRDGGRRGSQHRHFHRPRDSHDHTGKRDRH